MGKTPSRALSSEPIARPPPIMSHCQDTNRIWRIEVGNMIGEALYRRPADRQLGRNIRDGKARGGEEDDPIQGGRYLV